jgi:hypothetical protein
MESQQFESLLGAALAPLTPARMNGACGPWLVRAGGEGAIAVEIAGNWASLQCHAPGAPVQTSLDDLAEQSTWAGGVKRVGSGATGLLRADMPLPAPTPAGRARALRHLRAAAAGLLDAAGASDLAGGLAPKGDEPEVDAELLAYACTAGGWSPAVKPDGSVRIDLVLRGVQRTVVLQPGAAAIRVAVTLAPGKLGAAAAVCRAAAAMLLARASAALRWARAFAARHEGRLAGVGFECTLATPHDEPALLLAVDTLVAACELHGREVELLLEQPAIAAGYLQLHGRGDLAAEANRFSPGAACAQVAPAAAAPAAFA